VARFGRRHAEQSALVGLRVADQGCDVVRVEEGIGEDLGLLEAVLRVSWIGPIDISLGRWMALDVLEVGNCARAGADLFEVGVYEGHYAGHWTGCRVVGFAGSGWRCFGLVLIFHVRQPCPTRLSRWTDRVAGYIRVHLFGSSQLSSYSKLRHDNNMDYRFSGFSAAEPTPKDIAQGIAAAGGGISAWWWSRTSLEMPRPAAAAGGRGGCGFLPPSSASAAWHNFRFQTQLQPHSNLTPSSTRFYPLPGSA
jgi:hypothetical protein